METLSSLADFPLSLSDRPVVLCIGNFDGVHCGHRALFSAAQAMARDCGGRCGVLTFNPHPEVFFRGEGAVKLIYSQATKTALFERLGLDFAIFCPFTPEIAGLAAEDFVPALKKAIPALAGIFVGENFRFGARRRGDVTLLRESARAQSVSANALTPVLFESEKISSSRIRECLERGETEAADAMLGENYFASGTITSGRRLGRTIGFPTLNLPWEPELRPRFGVYAVKVKFGEQVFSGVANYGVRPTVEREGTPAPLLETFLPEVPAGASVPSYGDFIVVEWLKFLRPEQRFGSVDALREQLRLDRLAAADFFASRA